MNQQKVIIGWRTVSEKTGLSRYKLKELITKGQFPPPTRLGYRTLLWTCAEIAAWLANPQVGGNDE